MVPRAVVKKKGRPEAALVPAMRAAGLTLAVAESCTGGLLSGAITSVPGSSHCFLGGVVAYSNDVKTSLLGVREGTLKRFGAVSAETARGMARGVRRAVGADIGISITGIAGPGGGAPGKPVGTVFIGLSAGSRPAGGPVERAEGFRFSGTRGSVRRQSVAAALEMVMGLLGGV
ncbi:MAG: CinA family protein [Thermodesulfobacteriota bacterium]